MPSYDSKFNNEAIQRHNEHRKKHGAAPLSLDSKLAEQAQQYAQKLAATNQMQHASQEERNGAGENLAWMGGAELSAAASTDMWYDEVKDYDYNNPTFGMNTGHFTQVVWKSTKKAGFGIANTGNSYYVVGRYAPAGNLMGAFAENVAPCGTAPSSNKTQEKDNQEENNNGNQNETSQKSQCCTVL